MCAFMTLRAKEHLWAGHLLTRESQPVCLVFYQVLPWCIDSSISLSNDYTDYRERMLVHSEYMLVTKLIAWMVKEITYVTCTIEKTWR